MQIDGWSAVRSYEVLMIFTYSGEARDRVPRYTSRVVLMFLQRTFFLSFDWTMSMCRRDFLARWMNFTKLCYTCVTRRPIDCTWSGNLVIWPRSEIIIFKPFINNHEVCTDNFSRWTTELMTENASHPVWAIEGSFRRNCHDTLHVKPRLLWFEARLNFMEKRTLCFNRSREKQAQ